MKYRIKTFFRALAYSFLVVIFATAILPNLNESLEVGEVVMSLAPYYILWLLLTVASIVIRSKPFHLIWIGSTGDKELADKANNVYALIFMVGSIFIALAQFNI